MKPVEQLIVIVDEAIAKTAILENAEDSDREALAAVGFDLHQARAKLAAVTRPAIEDTSKWDLDKWMDFLAHPPPPFKLDLDESERQMLLMALAHLAVERPGCDYPLGLIASRIDEMTEAGPKLYNEFKHLHAPTHFIAGQLDLVGSALIQPPIKDEKTPTVPAPAPAPGSVRPANPGDPKHSAE